MKIGKRFIDREYNVNTVVKSKQNNNGDYICEIINDRWDCRNGETFIAQENYINTCREIESIEDLELIDNDYFCEYCELPCSVQRINDGHGKTEYWGRIGFDNHYTFSSDCCEGAVFKDINLVEEYDQVELEELYRGKFINEG